MKSYKNKFKYYKEKYKSNKAKFKDLENFYKENPSNQEKEKSKKSINDEKEKKKKKVNSEEENIEELESDEEQERQIQEKKSSNSKISRYHAILKINSLISANTRGWNINYKNKKKVEEYSKNDQISVGVIARGKVGKTWLINKILKKNFPSDYHQTTEGISIQYSNKKNTQLMVLLNFAGSDGSIFCYNKDNFDKYLSLLKKDKTGKIKFSEKFMEAKEFQTIRELMLNDKLMTENFIQNFILYTCNIIIIVVEEMTEHDQKIIENIKSLHKVKQRIIIVHNYFKLENKQDVLERINFEMENTLLNYKNIKNCLPNTNVPFFIEMGLKKEVAII